MATYGGGIVFTSNNSVFVDVSPLTTSVLYTVPATSNVYTELTLLSTYLLTNGNSNQVDVYIEDDNGNGGYVRNPVVTYTTTYVVLAPAGSTTYVGIELKLSPGQRVVMINSGSATGTIRIKANSRVYAPSV